MKNKQQSKYYFFGFIQLVLAFVVLTSAAQANTFFVTNTNDSGFGSFRQAIIDANNTLDTHNTIEFNIAGSGTKTINLQSPLPVIKLNRADCGFGNTLLIDGTTMSGYAGVPRVELNGASAGAANGLKIIWGIVTVKGLAINRFSAWGIHVQHDGSLHNPQCGGDDPPFTTLKLYGSRIGTDVNGVQDLGNGAGGVYIDANMTAYIGGSAANEPNVISGNVGNGIELYSSTAYINSNSIGTNLSGTAAIPNSFNGIKSNSGWMSVYDNVISSNGIDGIYVMSPSQYLNSPKTLIQGNRIGTNDAGTADLGNVANGINVDGGDDEAVLIGGNQAWMGNVISGNNQNGILVKALRTRIQGNFIGTNAAGNVAIPNTLNGVYMTVRHSIVGGEGNGEGNTISGNGDHGVKIDVVDDSYYAEVVGNRIGTNSAGTAALANGISGVSASAATNSNLGYEVRIRQNFISGNTSHGVYLTDGAKAIYVYGNYIGTNSINADLGNGGSGVYVFATAEDSTIESNAIAYNNGDGVLLQPGLGGGAAASDIKIIANQTYSNTGLGIDLGPTNGVTPNDFGDADTGPNGLQNFPVLQTATTTTLSGSLNSTANTEFEIHFYRTDVCDASGYGEGRFYLGSVDTTSDASGNATFTANFALSAGQIVVATATGYVNNSNGNTSEFSQCKTVVQTQPGNFTLGAATFNVNEGNGSLILGVNRTGGSDGTVTVNYTTSNGTATAGQDYTTTSGTLTFTNGQTVKNVTIPITNDPNDEPNQDFTFTLSNPTGGANIGNIPSAVITIIDNDNPPTVSVSDVSVVEGNENLTAFTFDLSLSNASAFATAVNWTTAPGGTATVGVDYQTNSGTVNFAAGETTKQVTVQVYGETLVEINETFFVNLSAPTNSTIGDGQGVGTILDDDNPGKLSFALAPYNVNENAGFTTVTITRTNGDAGTVTVDYATTNNGTATAFSDYTPVSDTLIFLDGELQKTFTVPISEDQIVENTESINLILSNTTGGASLGLSAAVINITDNDNGTSLAISGHIKKQDNSPLANVQVALQGTQNLTTTTDASGDYSFTGLTPNGNYTVTPSSFGFIFTPINREYLNLTNSVTNANFTADETPSRMVRVVGSDTVAGQPVSAIIEIVAQGDENSVGFSLNYDTSILSNPQVVLASDSSAASLVVNDTQTAQGRLGVLLSLPAGQTFAAGTKQLVEITFDTAQTQAYSTPLSFNNLPLAREVANVNADPLQTEWIAGTITFAQGYESDVSPRPMGTGNGTVTVADFSQIGRFVAGLNTPDQMNEFQRADTAPRISKGNGALTVSDYTQAGRYAAGLDPIQTAGGPTQANFATIINSNTDKNTNTENGNRVIRVVDASSFPGQQVFVAIEIDARGDENSFGFSVNYDPTKLSAPLVSLGADTQGNTLISNTLQPGRIGVLIGLAAGTSIQSGTRQLVVIRFNISNVAAAGQTPITFSDNPVGREIVDASVNVLQTDYTDGNVIIMGTTSASVSIGGRVTDANGIGISKASVIITNHNGETKNVLTNAFGYYQFTNVAVGETYILEVRSKRHHFNPNTQLLTVTEEPTQVNFVSDN